jgi:hypothetical protein
MNQYNVKSISTFAPLVHLGNVGELTVFNHRVPLMISIPLNALPGSAKTEDAQMSIPHEVTHAIFVQFPQLIEEIKTRLNSDIDDHVSKQTLSPRDALLYRIAVDWTEEICADLWGTALAGEKFAKSALWVMASSISMIGITDKTHPPTLVRPIVHLLALRELEADKQRFEEIRQRFQREIEPSQTPVDLNWDHRFRSVPALVFISMNNVSKILTEIVERILAMPLPSLGGVTMSKVLRTIDESKATPIPFEGWDKWGERANITSDNFVLEFPAELIPTYTTPGVVNLPDGWDIPWIRDILRVIRRG